MARSTRKSLAGTAAAAARKVMGRRASEDAAAPAAAATGKSSGAATTKKASAKAPAKKAPATKAPATKAPATKAPATKAPAKKAPATKAPAANAPAAKKVSTKKTSTKATVAQPAASRSAAKKTAVETTAAAKKTTSTKKASVKKTTTTPAAAPATKVAKKAPVSSLVVKEGEGDWTQAELDEVLAELHEQRDKLVHVLDETEHELAGLMKDAGDGAGQDQADMGATSFERDHELTVLNIERDMLAQIDRALGHIDDGSYGVCESCEQPIGKMRLMAFPRATLCMTCKQREERR